MNIVLTAGHSNVDPGAVGNGYKEADLMAELRNLVATELCAAGATVHTDGTGTDNWPLKDALALITKHKPKIAVELHMNAAAAQSATGVETIALPKDKRTAQAISLAIANVLGLRLRGDKGWIDQSQSARGRLGFVNAGGLIVEVAFISNPNDVKALLTNQQTLAKAIANTIVDEMAVL